MHVFLVNNNNKNGVATSVYGNITPFSRCLVDFPANTFSRCPFSRRRVDFPANMSIGRFSHSYTFVSIRTSSKFPLRRIRKSFAYQGYI